MTKNSKKKTFNTKTKRPAAKAKKPLKIKEYAPGLFYFFGGTNRPGGM